MLQLENSYIGEKESVCQTILKLDDDRSAVFSSDNELLYDSLKVLVPFPIQKDSPWELQRPLTLNHLGMYISLEDSKCRHFLLLSGGIDVKKGSYSPNQDSWIRVRTGSCFFYVKDITGLRTVKEYPEIKCLPLDEVT